LWINILKPYPDELVRHFITVQLTTQLIFNLKLKSMKTLFRKLSAGTLLAVLFLNVNVEVKAQWSITGNSSISSGSPATNFIGTTDANDIVFKTNNLEYMRLIGASTNRGNLGIQTTAPISPLQVGNAMDKVSIGKCTDEGAYVGFNASLSGGNFTIHGDGDNSAANAIMTDLNGYLTFVCTPSAGSSTTRTMTEDNFRAQYRMQLQTSGRVDIPGNLSIGTVASHPSGYKLFVDDGIITEKLKVATQTWSDFVFDKSYKLMPLAQVEKYIDKNKHLPDVPSAKEMVENGLDVATMDAKLLQKIEELTLYLIEMKKDNEAQKKSNEELKTRLSNLENNH
jgi:hypothetical protein